jgi:lysophospholipase L1-like esterase
LKLAAWRFVGALGLVASAIPACAQNPQTVTPQRRDGSWMEMHRRFVNEAKKGDVDLLFLGDSITQMWNNNDVWQRFYGSRKAANFGLGGDGTQHLLWRISNGELAGITPKVVVLLIGTNNISTSSAEEIAQGITAIVHVLRDRLPNAQVLLLGIFPRDPQPSPGRDRIKAVNQRIAKLEDGIHVRFLDIEKAFLNPDDTISPAIMPDYLHLSRRGYRIWADAMEPALWSMLDEPSRTH